MWKIRYININKKCYNALAAEYNKRNNPNQVGEDLAKKISSVLEDYMVKENYRILELGCGTGNILAGLPNNHKYKLYAIDFSKNMIHYAADNCKYANIVEKDVLAIRDIFDVFNEKDKFDIIIMAAFIHLFPRKGAEKLLKKIKGWLNSNGLIYIDTSINTANENEKFKDGEITEKKEYNVSVKRLRTRWTEEKFEDFLDKCGFDINFIYYNNHKEEGDDGKTWLRRIVKIK